MRVRSMTRFLLHVPLESSPQTGMSSMDGVVSLPEVLNSGRVQVNRLTGN